MQTGLIRDSEERAHSGASSQCTIVPVPAIPAVEGLTAQMQEVLSAGNRALRLVDARAEKALKEDIEEIGGDRLLEMLKVSGLTSTDQVTALLQQKTQLLTFLRSQSGRASIKDWRRKRRRAFSDGKRMVAALLPGYLSLRPESMPGGGRDRDSVRELEARRLLTKSVGEAMRYIEDVSLLNRSPLARSGAVEKLVREKYARHITPRGFALRELLLRSVDRVTNEAGGEPSLEKECCYLKLAASGVKCSQISKELQLSREHVSRVYRKKALDLLVDELLLLLKEGQ